MCHVWRSERWKGLRCRDSWMGMEYWRHNSQNVELKRRSRPGLWNNFLHSSSLRTLSSKRFEEKINKARQLCVDAKGRLERERTEGKKTNLETYSGPLWQQPEGAGTQGHRNETGRKSETLLRGSMNNSVTAGFCRELKVIQGFSADTNMFI